MTGSSDGGEVDRSDLHRAVGHVAVAAADLELAAANLHAMLLRSDVGHVEVLGQNWRVTIDACRALAQARADYDRVGGANESFEALADQLPKLLRRADDLMRNRNLVLHGQWYTSADPNTAIAQLLKRWYRIEDREWSVAQIDDLGKEIEQVTAALEQCVSVAAEAWQRIEDAH